MKKVFLTIAMAFLIGGLCIQCSSSDAKSAASTQTKEATPDQPQTIQSDMTTQSLEIDAHSFWFSSDLGRKDDAL